MRDFPAALGKSENHENSSFFIVFPLKSMDFHGFSSFLQIHELQRQGSTESAYLDVRDVLGVLADVGRDELEIRLHVRYVLFEEEDANSEECLDTVIWTLEIDILCLLFPFYGVDTMDMFQN